MIFYINGTEYGGLRLRDAIAYFDSGIEFRQVGGITKRLYRGSAYKHYSSDVTVTGNRSSVEALRSAILSFAETGGNPIRIKAETYERFLGPEFVDGLDAALFYIDPLVGGLPMDTGDGPDHYSVSFMVNAMQGIESYISSGPDSSLFSTVPMKINRERNSVYSMEKNEISISKIGFEQSYPTVEIEYNGTREQIGKMRAAASTFSSLPVSLSFNTGFVFDTGVQTANAYILSMVDSGPLNAAGTRYGLVVTFAKA